MPDKERMQAMGTPPGGGDQPRLGLQPGPPGKTGRWMTRNRETMATEVNMRLATAKQTQVPQDLGRNREEDETMSVAGSSDREIDAESDGFQDEAVQETSEEASKTKEQDALLDRYFHTIEAHVYGGGETETKFLWEENVGRLFLKLAEEIVPGIAEFAARKSASSEAEKQLMASTQRLENMSTKRQEIKTCSSKLEKELQQLREESVKIGSEVQKELEVAKTAKKRMTEQI
ncbi:hypothetical protein H4R99_002610 [Coemansia sp. RSA 1722]|nr:hypothetical protein IWW45_004593 [Coemansia sp. RSA 485]KAJ2602645.1 hypothetical protein H4R99_002610 [Coemansia sp. RSA 1722]